MVSHAGIVNTFVRKQLESEYILSTSAFFLRIRSVRIRSCECHVFELFEFEYIFLENSRVYFIHGLLTVE